jgi:hypothetical protein
MTTVVVEPVTSDSVPAALSAVTARICGPGSKTRRGLSHVMPFTTPLKPGRGGDREEFVVPAGNVVDVKCLIQFFAVTVGEQAGTFVKS